MKDLEKIIQKNAFFSLTNESVESIIVYNRIQKDFIYLETLK